MMTQLLVTEMAATVERERMVEFARLRQDDRLARAGQKIGQQARARKVIGAFLQRMGRNPGNGAAPAGGNLRNSHTTIDRARPATESLSIPRI